MDETENAIVAHSIQFRDRKLKKGHIISRDDIEALKKEGIGSIVVARLEDGDIGEDTAAAGITEALGNKSLGPGKAFTGRCNLYSKIRGLLRIRRTVIDQINKVDESVTIATLRDYSVVEADELVTTVKIIPFAVRSDDLETCLEVIKNNSPVIEVLPFKPRRVGLIQTILPGTKENILDKTYEVLTRRVENLDSKIISELRVEHDESRLVNAIDTLIENNVDMLMIVGASAIVDRRDVIPAAIEKSGGEILHYGMPTDPGNLLLLARHQDIPVLGLPGCARSPKRNGLDLVLERLAVDIHVTSSDIMLLGTGGLLKEISIRPQPRKG